MIGQVTYNKPLLQNWCKASCRSCTTNLKGTYYSNPSNESETILVLLEKISLIFYQLNATEKLPLKVNTSCRKNATNNGLYEANVIKFL